MVTHYIIGNVRSLVALISGIELLKQILVLLIIAKSQKLLLILCLLFVELGYIAH